MSQNRVITGRRDDNHSIVEEKHPIRCKCEIPCRLGGAWFLPRDISLSLCLSVWHLAFTQTASVSCSAQQLASGTDPIWTETRHENQKSWHEGNTCHVISNDSFSIYWATHTHTPSLTLSLSRSLCLDCSHVLSRSSTEHWASLSEFAVVLSVSVCVLKNIFCL